MMSTITRLTAMVGGMELILVTAGAAQEGFIIGACSDTHQTIFASSNYAPLFNLTVKIAKNSRSPAILHLSADLCVSAHAEVRVAYQIDRGGPMIFGPRNLANHEEFCVARTTMAVVPLPDSRPHTITPVWLVSGAAGKRATFIDGCLAVEFAAFN